MAKDTQEAWSANARRSAEQDPESVRESNVRFWSNWADDRELTIRAWLTCCKDCGAPWPYSDQERIAAERWYRALRVMKVSGAAMVMFVGPHSIPRSTADGLAERVAELDPGDRALLASALADAQRADALLAEVQRLLASIDTFTHATATRMRPRALVSLPTGGNCCGSSDGTTRSPRRPSSPACGDARTEAFASAAARAIRRRSSAARSIAHCPDCKRAREAAVILEAELAAIAGGAVTTKPGMLPAFADWAVTVFERKLANGNIVSAAGRARWEQILRLHLIPAYGPILVDQLTRADIEQWKATELLAPRAIAKDARRKRKLEAGRYSPGTANTILGVLRQVTAEASREFNIRDVAADIDNVNTREHRTYTYEEPNSIKPADVPRFLAEMRVRYPDHYAFVFLGFTTGLRPSSLRPLRRRGPNADVKCDEGKLLVHRSHTRGSEVMEATKTGVDQVIDLDPEQLAVMRWHLDRLERENERRAKRSPHVAEMQRASELLFPAAPTRWSAGGGLQSRSCLDKAFKAIAKQLELGYEVSPRAKRRSFQDLARAAQVKDLVTRAISGHATETMQRHYSTVASSEVREGLAKVIDIATGRERRAA